MTIENLDMVMFDKAMGRDVKLRRSNSNKVAAATAQLPEAVTLS
jgi:hypothetical protein